MSPEEHDDLAGGGLPEFLQDPVGMLKRRWRWMLVGLVLGLALTGGVVSQLGVRYIGEATVLFASQRIPEDFVRPTVEEDLLERIDAMIAEIMTREKLSDIIERHELYLDKRDSVTRGELVAHMKEFIVIEPHKSKRRQRYETAQLIRVAFEHESPQVAAAVANDLAGLLPAESVRMRTRQARLATEFLRRELERADEELRLHAAEMRAFQEQYRGELPTELDANLAKLERLQQERESLALQIAEASNRVTTLSAGQGADASSPDARLAALRAELEAERAVKTAKHPTVVALEQQIAGLEAQLAGSETSSGGAPTISTLVAAEQRMLNHLRSRLATTEQEIADLDERVERTPAREEEMAALVQKETVLRETYLEYLRKVQDAELAQSLESAQQGERVAVINRAEPPSVPARSRLKFAAAGVMAALGLAFAIGAALEALDPVLVNAAQLETAAELPVLGSVPTIS